jgi:two-component system OmpR family response regulator
VSGHRVLIIEGDEWVSAVLGRVLVDSGYVVDLANDARSGLSKARTVIPDCVICDVVLPDIDGFWVAKRLRTDQGPVSQIPILFLTEGDDGQSGMQGLAMGADVYVTKPFRNEEVVAQVAALISMANRLRKKRDSVIDIPPSSRTPGGTVFNGDLSQFSAATALALLEMERRTGTLQVKTKEEDVVFDVDDGALLRVLVNGKERVAVEVLRDVMKWTEGRFSFKSGSVKPGFQRQGIGVLLLEAMRREDEANR